VIIQESFPNMTKFLEYLNSPTDMPSENRTSMNREYSSWTQTKDLPEALELARKGWHEGAKKVEQMSIMFTEEILRVVELPMIRFDVTGDQLDVGRFVNGEPEDFMYFEEVERKETPKIIHIIMNISTSGSVSGNTMIVKGSAVVALVNALEKTGKRVIVDCADGTGPSGYSSRQSKDLLINVVRIKESDGPVNLANLAMMLAHPAALRRLIFCAQEHQPSAIRRKFGIGSNYGRVRELPEDKRGDIYIAGSNSFLGRWNEENAKTWVLKQLKEQGIKIREEKK